MSLLGCPNEILINICEHVFDGGHGRDALSKAGRTCKLLNNISNEIIYRDISTNVQPRSKLESDSPHGFKFPTLDIIGLIITLDSNPYLASLVKSIDIVNGIVMGNGQGHDLRRVLRHHEAVGVLSSNVPTEMLKVVALMTLLSLTKNLAKAKLPVDFYPARFPALANQDLPFELPCLEQLSFYEHRRSWVNPGDDLELGNRIVPDTILKLLRASQSIKTLSLSLHSTYNRLLAPQGLKMPNIQTLVLDFHALDACERNTMMGIKGIFQGCPRLTDLSVGNFRIFSLDQSDSFVPDQMRSFFEPVAGTLERLKLMGSNLCTVFPAT